MKNKKNSLAKFVISLYHNFAFNNESVISVSFILSEHRKARQHFNYGVIRPTNSAANIVDMMSPIDNLTTSL